MVSDLVTPGVEQCCIIKFLAKENMKPAEILQMLNAQNGCMTVSCGCVCDWYSFMKSTKKHAYVQPNAVCSVNIHCVRKLIFGNRWITVYDNASSSGIRGGRVETVIHEHSFKRVCARWVSKIVFNRTAQCDTMFAKHLHQFELEENTFLYRVVTCGK
jgi:hypothetical protein